VLVRVQHAALRAALAQSAEHGDLRTDPPS
jgi:hypothetical protein